MSEIAARGWLKSPTGCWHHGRVDTDGWGWRGLLTDCGKRALPDWGLNMVLLQPVPPEGKRICQRCERHFIEEAG